MLSYVLLLSLINIVFAYNPSCNSCKWFVPVTSNKLSTDLGLCSMFKNSCYDNEGNEVVIRNFATHCRNDENLCGKSGVLYESKNVVAEYDEASVNKKQIMDDYDELNNRCCGEVNEKSEIEQLERDFFEIYQRIKKFNVKRIYKANKDLYKLFKRGVK